MKKDSLPKRFPEIDNSIYAGFWIRLAAAILDVFIFLPFVLLILYLQGISKMAFYFTIIPNLAFFIWYNVFLVKRYGGTPGKLITGIKIVKASGDDIDWHAAIIRNIVDLSLSIFGIIILITGLTLIDDSTYLGLRFMERGKFITDLNPTAFKVQTWLLNIWSIGEFVILLTNTKRRSVQDYMACTVVVKSIYLDKVRKLIKL